MTVLEIDHGAERLGRIVHELASAAAPMAVVGVMGAKAAEVHRDGDGDGDTPLTNVEIAAVHEFGARIPRADGSVTVIPTRSFLRGTIDAHETDIAAFKSRTAQGLLDGRVRDAEHATKLLAAYVVGLVQRRIAAGIDPELADSTIERKGSSTPLIDKGQLRSAIAGVSRRGGAKGGE